jgi:hypothetical protein
MGLWWCPVPVADATVSLISCGPPGFLTTLRPSLTSSGTTCVLRYGGDAAATAYTAFSAAGFLRSRHGPAGPQPVSQSPPPYPPDPTPMEFGGHFLAAVRLQRQPGPLKSRAMPVEFKDYYAVLGVPRDGGDQESLPHAGARIPPGQRWRSTPRPRPGFAAGPGRGSRRPACDCQRAVAVDEFGGGAGLVGATAACLALQPAKRIGADPRMNNSRTEPKARRRSS